MNKKYQKTFPGEKNAGFTLIELLVVVLIIGILAAVALPQYEKAVIKSRFAAWIPLVKSLADAEEQYYLANGQYTDNLEDLDVTLPNSLKQTNDATTICAGTTAYKNEDGSVQVGFAWNGTTLIGVQVVFPKQKIGYRIVFQNYNGGVIPKNLWGKSFCMDFSNDPICPWLTGEKQLAIAPFWCGYWYLM